MGPYTVYCLFQCIELQYDGSFEFHTVGVMFEETTEMRVTISPLLKVYFGCSPKSTATYFLIVVAKVKGPKRNCFYAPAVWGRTLIFLLLCCLFPTVLNFNSIHAFQSTHSHVFMCENMCVRESA